MFPPHFLIKSFIFRGKIEEGHYFVKKMPTCRELATKAEFDETIANAGDKVCSLSSMLLVVCRAAPPSFSFFLLFFACFPNVPIARGS